MRRKRHAFRVVLMFLLGFVVAEPVTAQTAVTTNGATGKRLKQVEQAIEAGRLKAEKLKQQADKLEKEMTVIRRAMVTAAQTIQGREQAAADIRDRIAELDLLRKEKQAVLNGQRAKMGRVLLALQRVARHPPEALITQTMSPADTVRSAILLRAAVPEIERRAHDMRDDLMTLDAAKQEVREQRTKLAHAVDELEVQRRNLHSLLGQKLRLRRRTVAKSNAAEQRVKTLAREATSLRELMSRLEILRRKREADAKNQEKAAATGETTMAAIAKPELGPPPNATGKPITLARGTLPFPVVGRLVGRYGQAATGGMTRKGITIETAPDAQVVATYEGRVVFAGKFRGYGQLLIIEHSEGYHSLLAGVTRIDIAMGQWVVAGEPIGVMGHVEGQRPVLYVELRRNGQPINPLPWLAARKGKVNG